MNQKGYSLVEIMIGAGLVSVIAMGLMTLLEINDKTQSVSKVKNEISTVVNTIREEISNEQICLKRFSLDTTTLNSLSEADIIYNFPPSFLKSGENPHLKMKEITSLGVHDGQNFYRGILTLNYLVKSAEQQKHIGMLFFKVNSGMTLSSCQSEIY